MMYVLVNDCRIVVATSSTRQGIDTAAMQILTVGAVRAQRDAIIWGEGTMKVNVTVKKWRGKNRPRVGMRFPGTGPL